MCTLGVLILVLPAPPRAKAQDEPAPAVARISVVEGEVFTLRGDSKDWMVATANAPLMRGGALATGPGSRAELQLDYANVFRLDQSTEAKVADLTRGHIQIQVATGLVNFAVFRGAEADVEIDTPNVAVHTLGEGLYRLQVKSAEYALLTVCWGHAEVTTSQGSMPVGNGQIIYVKGVEYPEYQITPAFAKDDWDRWNDDRDHAIADPQAWQHTNRYYMGSEDFERYGDWVQVPGYGWCWTPYVDAGWAPYREGRWVSDPYFAWVWVGYEPWGWAPYHYGRWFSYDGKWCWWPAVGFEGPRPNWGPGYVAFFGFGGPSEGPGLGLDFDSISWCPLGPRDHFDPWWGPGRGFNTADINNIDAVPAPRLNDPPGRDYGTNLHGILTNAHLRNAITTVSVANFANGRIAANLQPMDINLLQQGKLMQGTLPVTPTKTSLQPLNRPINRAALPGAAANNQHFFTRSVGPASHLSLPAGQFNPFAKDQRVGAGAPASATGSEMSGTRQNPAVGDKSARLEAGPPETPSDYRRFGGQTQTNRSLDTMNSPGIDGGEKAAPPPPSAPLSPLAPAAQGNHGGWRHFGSQPAPANRFRE